MKYNNMDWLRDFSEEELSSMLRGDLLLIYSLCGLEVLQAICENLMGLNLYISTKSLREAMKVYAIRNFDGTNHKELAVKLGVSEKCIYDFIQEARYDKDRG
ncbi:hypothetical protein A45J_1860 [hot springs metagenome]